MAGNVSGETTIASLEEATEQTNVFFSKVKKIAAMLGDLDGSVKSSGDLELLWHAPNGYAVAMHRGDQTSMAEVIHQTPGKEKGVLMQAEWGDVDYNRDNPLLVHNVRAKLLGGNAVEYVFRSKVDECGDFFEDTLWGGELVVPDISNIDAYSFEPMLADTADEIIAQRLLVLNHSLLVTP